ncbi:MAG: FHA domain-containing protein [Pseudolysinimonas sp.]
MPPGPEVAVAPDDDEDRTVLAPPRVPQSTWVLVTPSGTRERITGTVVVGRQPAKTAFKGSTATLKLADPDGQISKSHAVFEVDAQGLWVRDLESTNGVVVIAPNGEETTVTGDVRVAVTKGAEVELGGFVVTIDQEG